MHHALKIQEILFIIFQFCRLPSSVLLRGIADLPSLARTCRAFKDPALDVLWAELYNARPLAQCLPEASHRVSNHYEYSFSRFLTQTEWDILRSYTRRVRVILDFTSGLNWKSVRTFLVPPTAEPLFPNLRYLSCEHSTCTTPLLHLPLLSLLTLGIKYVSKRDRDVVRDTLKSIPELAPNIKRLVITVSRSKIVIDNYFCRYICLWKNLQDLRCSKISLDMATLSHISALVARLEFMLSSILLDQIASSGTSLIFSNLGSLTLHSEFLTHVSGLFSLIQLPLVTDFSAFVEGRPYKQDVSSFLTAVHTSGIGHTIQGLQVHPSDVFTAGGENSPLLDLEDLRPCMTFGNLRRIDLDFGWNVGLRDDDLLELTSVWPYLEQFLINVDSGWNTPGGITPDGLLQLLRTCRSLNRVALAIDTRDYTETRTIQSLADLGLTLPCTFSINIIDTVIEEESIPAIAAFFASITPCPNFHICSWSGAAMMESPYWEIYTHRWNDVYGLVNDAVSRRS